MNCHLQSFGLSDIGMMRHNNEDEWTALAEIGFFALADGMGGHQGGDIAAKQTLESLCDLVQKIETQDCVELIIELRHAIEKANQKIYQMSQSIEALSGMGTTLCCLFWKEKAVIYAHVGDSRIYRYRNKKLEQLTRDHSLLSKWLATGKIAKECETPFPYKNVITRAVGTSKKANPEIAITSPEPEDLYLLCSDGLSDVLTLEEMEAIIGANQDIKSLAESLIEKAKLKGSCDNMTVLVVRNFPR